MKIVKLPHNSILIVLCVFMFNGCATVTQGTTQDVTFSSNPAGAKVVLKSAGDRHEFKTPATIQLSKNKNYVAIFQKEGYETVSYSLVRGSSGWQLGNIIFGGAIGTYMDSASGAGTKFKESRVHIDLVQKANDK